MQTAEVRYSGDTLPAKDPSFLRAMRDRIKHETAVLDTTVKEFHAIADKAFGEAGVPLGSKQAGPHNEPIASTMYGGEAGDLEAAIAELDAMVARMHDTIYRFSQPLD